MDALALLLTEFSSGEIALLLLALLYAVLAPAWLAAALALPGDRAAAGWWAAYAGGSALGLLLIALGMHESNVLLRALGNIAVLGATLALQRGIWIFTGQRRWTAVQAAVWCVVAVLSLLAMDPAWVWARITFVAGLWSALYLWSAIDVWRHVRARLQQRWGALYAAPLLLGAAVLGLRTMRAVISPETVIYEVEQNTVLSVGSSLVGLVAALLLQMTLVALVLSRLLGRLERLSRHDPLTGLLNRRAMGELLAQEEHRVRRLAASGQAGGQVSVLMIDIDHFKEINDHHGHAAGDRALLQLATLMASQLREMDHLARWGGEEFLALLPATSGSDALVLAERLCERVRHLPLHGDSGPIALTASFGVADWAGAQDSMAALLKRADDALYAAKRGGRDRVVSGLAPRPLPARRLA